MGPPGYACPDQGDLVEEHFPQAIQIVDWYHAVEYIASVAQAAFGQPVLARGQPAGLCEVLPVPVQPPPSERLWP